MLEILELSQHSLEGTKCSNNPGLVATQLCPINLSSHDYLAINYIIILSSHDHLAINYIIILSSHDYLAEVQLDTSSRGSSARMESKSGVVGKFRSHYNTIEQVTIIKLIIIINHLIKNKFSNKFKTTSQS